MAASSVNRPASADLIDVKNAAFNSKDHSPVLNTQSRFWSALKLLYIGRYRLRISGQLLDLPCDQLSLV